jgi:hypothetical protein
VLASNQWVSSLVANAVSDGSGSVQLKPTDRSWRCKPYEQTRREYGVALNGRFSTLNGAVHAASIQIFGADREIRRGKPRLKR